MAARGAALKGANGTASAGTRSPPAVMETSTRSLDRAGGATRTFLFRPLMPRQRSITRRTCGAELVLSVT